MALKLVIDTSAYSGFKKGDESLRPFITTQNNLFVPVIVLGELRSGFAAGSKQTENERSLQLFLSYPSVEVLFLTDETTKIMANLYAKLRKTGKMIGSNDLWIAALAIEHKLPLLTLDKDFSSIAGLEIIDI